MDWQKFLISIGISIVITIIGFALSLADLFWFLLIMGIIGFLLRFVGIHILDLTPLIIISPMFYILFVYLFGTFDVNVLTNTITFLFKLIPSVMISNVVSEILFPLDNR